MSLTLLAAAGGQDDVLRLLIKKGVKVNARQKNGTTALMHAAEKVQKNSVQELSWWLFSLQSLIHEGISICI